MFHFHFSLLACCTLSVFKLVSLSFTPFFYTLLCEGGAGTLHFSFVSAAYQVLPIRGSRRRLEDHGSLLWQEWWFASVITAESNFQISALPAPNQHHNVSSETSASARWLAPLLSGLSPSPIKICLWITKVLVMTKSSPFLEVWVFILWASPLSF